MKKLTILVDMDGILVDLYQYWLKLIEADHGVGVDPDEIVRWDMHTCGPLVALGAKKTYAYLQQPGFFLNAPALPGAIEGFQELLHRGHDVVIASSAAGGQSAKEKYEWLAQKIPNLSRDNVSLITRKELLDGDVLIDDRAETLVKYATRRPESLCLGIGYPYNADVDKVAGNIRRLGSYKDTAAAWKSIVQAVDALAAA